MVLSIPLFSTNVAELVFTFAGYMIAAFSFLYYRLAIVALFIIQVLFQKVKLVSVAVSIVFFEIAFWTEFLLTFVTFSLLSL